MIVPIMHIWSKNRRWDTSNKSSMFAWSHPLLYKLLSIAFISPSIWGIYFSIIRYNRLGLTIQVLPIENTTLLDFLILLPFNSMDFYSSQSLKFI